MSERKRIMRKASIVAVVLTLGFAAQIATTKTAGAQQPVFKATGYVLDSADHTPIAGARVWFVSSSLCESVTGYDGIYAVICNSGSELCATATGYKRKCYWFPQNLTGWANIWFPLMPEFQDPPPPPPDTTPPPQDDLASVANRLHSSAVPLEDSLRQNVGQTRLMLPGRRFRRS